MRPIRTVTELGAGIRELRKNAGLTQAEVAHRAHVSRAFLSELERGQRPRAELARVLAVLQALDTGVVLTEHKSMSIEEALTALLGL